MYELVESTWRDDSPERRALAKDYYASLTAPQDGMWETFSNRGRQLAVRAESEIVAFLSLDAEGRMLRFQPSLQTSPSQAAEAFAAVAALDQVKGAITSTGDPLLTSLSLDHHQTVEVHSYLYRDNGGPLCGLADDAEVRLEQVRASALDSIAELQRAQLDWDPGDWLRGYLQRLIRRGELFALHRGDEILATGETRVSDSQPPFVDLGVITVRAHRRTGVASHLLSRLKHLSYERGLKPICSTTVDNVGSQRAIERAGFVSIHRLLEVTF